MKPQVKQPPHKNQKMVPPIITKALLVASCLAAAASASPLYRRQFSQESSLVQDAPFASDLAGVHLLLNNDLDSNTPKHPVIFLAEARSYKDSKHVCDRLGEGITFEHFQMRYPILTLVKEMLTS